MGIVDEGKDPGLICLRDGNGQRRGGPSPFPEGGDTEPISGIWCPLQHRTTIFKVACNIGVLDKLDEDLKTAVHNDDALANSKKVLLIR